MIATPVTLFAQGFCKLDLQVRVDVLDQLHSSLHWMRPRAHRVDRELELAQTPCGTGIAGLDKFPELAALKLDSFPECELIWRGKENAPLLSPLIVPVLESLKELGVDAPRESLWPLRHFLWHQRDCGSRQLVLDEFGQDVDTWR